MLKTSKSMKSGTFRTTQWDPFLLISQIIAMQSVLYFTLSLLMSVMDVLAGANHTLDHIFQYHDIQISELGGRLIILGFVLNAFIGAIALWYIVQRTKLCLDFSCTFHGIHLIACWWYNSSFPSNYSWWLLNAVCATFMCVAGEFLCLKTELKEIPVGYTALNQKSDV